MFEVSGYLAANSRTRQRIPTNHCRLRRGRCKKMPRNGCGRGEVRFTDVRCRWFAPVRDRPSPEAAAKRHGRHQHQGSPLSTPWQGETSRQKRAGLIRPSHASVCMCVCVCVGMRGCLARLPVRVANTPDKIDTTRGAHTCLFFHSSQLGVRKRAAGVAGDPSVRDIWASPRFVSHFATLTQPDRPGSAVERGRRLSRIRPDANRLAGPSRPSGVVFVRPANRTAD
ncbi:hypothetical protein LY78DRAFT_486961 [Colletotrichum sublineola]|nr:hypothetical protein LY78DRAFT_486961 [Colletotrichum sublineola]